MPVAFAESPKTPVPLLLENLPPSYVRYSVVEMWLTCVQFSFVPICVPGKTTEWKGTLLKRVSHSFNYQRSLIRLTLCP